MKQTLRDRLLKYLKNNPQWFASGELQRIVLEKTTYTPQTTGRVLRQLCTDGLIEVTYRKNHAWYKIYEEPRSQQKLS